MENGEASGSAEVSLGGAAQLGWHVVLRGKWLGQENLPTADHWWQQECGEVTEGIIHVIAVEVTAWDGRMVAFLHRLRQIAGERGLMLQIDAVPPSVDSLLQLSASKPLANVAERALPPPIWQCWRLAAQRLRISIVECLSFIGSIAIAITLLLRRCLPVRRKDYLEIFRQVGTGALPIAALISFLTGIILGFVGAIQLASFGAAIYVANLVGLAMAREMAPIMLAVILTGRTGAAFASTIGTMRTNGEVDALETFGFSAMEFLVLPRVLALLCMMPILCIFSIFIGIGGGMIVSVPMFNFSAAQYLTQTISAVTAHDFLFGVSKSAVFALLIGGLSCRCGLRCERNANGVGAATTNAVVSGIVAIVIVDALFAAMGNALGV
ncbi:MAG: ABC transporter permease [Puniceicoccales bacterium]|jgi:phospholipid/cholesterol/gamma-HCH transport system permease protein|nr:ABC transporter permease [Puniceicoccales bacterium]